MPAGNNDTWQRHTCICLDHLGWQVRDRIISICCAAQGGQGKYSSDSHETFAWLSHAAVAVWLTVSLTNFTNVNDPLDARISKKVLPAFNFLKFYQDDVWTPRIVGP